MQKLSLNYERKLPEADACDVLVCGGGPAGVTAALAAAREGLKVCLIEAQAQLGGMSTSGHVAQWLGGRTQDGDWVVAGLFRQLAEAALADGCAKLPVRPKDRVYQPHGWMPWFAHGVPVDPFGLARLLDRTLRDAGVDLLFETRAVDVVAGEERITHVVTGCKEGLRVMPAQVVIDATGDADIAAFSGCPYDLGREPDHLTTISSLMFHIRNVDAAALSDFIERHKSPKFVEQVKALRAAGEWPFEVNWCLTTQLVDDDVFMLNAIHMLEVCGIDTRSRSAALVQGREACHKLLEVLRKHFPGFGNARMKSVASTLGVRETRRIKGAFRLSADDVARGMDFPDTIGFSMFGWDLLDPKSPNRQPGVDLTTGRYVYLREKPPVTPIPYRVLVPEPVRNLLCPGRAVSVERDALGPLRVMAPCMAMGEAAGAAAGPMVREGIAAAEVDVENLRARLRAAGALVDCEALPPITKRADPE